MPPTREHLQKVLRGISGIDVTLTELYQAASFADRAMQITVIAGARVPLPCRV